MTSPRSAMCLRGFGPHALFSESASPMKQRPVHPTLPRHHEPRRLGPLWRHPDRQVPCPSGDDLQAGTVEVVDTPDPTKSTVPPTTTTPPAIAVSPRAGEGVNDGTMRRNEVLDRGKGWCAWYRVSVREPKRDTTISDNHTDFLLGRVRQSHIVMDWVNFPAFLSVVRPHSANQRCLGRWPQDRLRPS
jgi:hypothetical protein